MPKDLKGFIPKMMNLDDLDGEERDKILPLDDDGLPAQYIRPPPPGG